jgi:endonuclease YncB( thermonuclease family)
MRIRMFVLLLALAVVGSVAPAAQATHGSLHRWDARVTYVADGDTFDVDIKGDGTSKTFRVRMAGIQAMEHDECHYAEATRSLSGLIGGKLVRLRAFDPNSRAFEGGSRDARLLRFVQVRRNGVWTDVGDIQIRRGHTLWHPHPVENLYDKRYHRGMMKAAAAGKNLWNTRKCGVGPQQNLPLRMWLQSDADSNDFNNLNGEWVKIYNESTDTTARLGGWKIRMAPRFAAYTFASGTQIPPGETLTVFVGKGSDTALEKYWGRDKPLFRNVDDSPGKYVGDGMYLYDPDLDLRRWFTYPCARACTDPLQGKVEFGRVVYSGSDESIEVRNTTLGTVDLYGYNMESWPYSYEFEPGTELGPLETLTVHIGKGNDTPLKKFWGMSDVILNNTGDSIVIRTFDYIRIQCHSWGSGHC